MDHDGSLMNAGHYTSSIYCEGEIYILMIVGLQNITNFSIQILLIL